VFDKLWGVPALPFLCLNELNPLSAICPVFCHCLSIFFISPILCYFPPEIAILVFCIVYCLLVIVNCSLVSGFLFFSRSWFVKVLAFWGLENRRPLIWNILMQLFLLNVALLNTPSHSKSSGATGISFPPFSCSVVIIALLCIFYLLSFSLPAPSCPSDPMASCHHWVMFYLAHYTYTAWCAMPKQAQPFPRRSHHHFFFEIQTREYGPRSWLMAKLAWGTLQKVFFRWDAPITGDDEVPRINFLTKL